MKNFVITVISILSYLTMNATGTDLRILVGTYTDTESDGIYTYAFNQSTGKSEFISATKAVNPSFLTISKDKSMVYAVSESATTNDYLCSFTYQKNKIGKQVSKIQTDGIAPCNVVYHKDYIITSNYTSGSISVFKTDKSGKLTKRCQVLEFPFIGESTDTIRQKSAHLHCVKPSPDNSVLFACDLGNDCIYTLQFSDNTDSLKVINTTKLPTATGPRHLTFSDDGNFAYLISELSGEIFVFIYANSSLNLIQTIKCDFANAHGSADIHQTPNGKFLYASNRLKDDGIAIYRVNDDGKLTYIGYQLTGIHPRNFAITPNGKYILCACRDSNCIEVYELDKNTGLLSNIHKNIYLPHPVCILIVSNNKNE